jgi:7,8-dihydropterin-6-yl-methyl-4-(beta-D-ribofuranosyl)aminobenzene 5'-phosphate synthase
MSENKLSRKDFIKGAAMGIAGGSLAAMGLYSYSPMSKQHLASKTRKLKDFGTCKSVKVTNISETSWFDNATLMGDIKKAGGLLVNQYSYNWPPFGNGKGIGKGTYEDIIAKIRDLLPNRLEEAWAIIEKQCVSVKNAGASRPSSRWRRWTGRRKSTSWTQAGPTSGWTRPSRGRA